MATLGELMTRELLEVAPEDTLGQAAEAMVERGVGSAVVSDFGRLIGILTERDLLRAVAGRVHSSEARVREWMTHEPSPPRRRPSSRKPRETMLEQGFRHLPVVDDERAIGIVSIRDVVDWTVRGRRALG